MLVEFAMGTAVYPIVDSTMEGVAKVTDLWFLNTADADNQNWGWNRISLNVIMRRVKR